MTTQHATNDGVAIAYEVRDDAGDDRPWAVLVHGLGYGRWGWEPVVEPLAARLRLLLPDNRGIGASDVPPGPYTVSDMAADLTAVLADAGVDRPHVVGISGGGMVAQELAVRHPERVDRLVLVATTPGGERAYPIPDATRALIAEMPELPPEEALRRAVENALADPDGRIVDRILHHRLTDPQDRDGWQAQAEAFTTYDGGERLARITAPTLVVQGERDAVIDPRNAGVLAELLPDVRVERHPDAGHLVMWEDPDWFVAVVSDFLGGGGGR